MRDILGERVAALEERARLSEDDRQNLWQAVDELKHRIGQVEGVAASARGRAAGMDLRVGNLEKREAVSTHQMNLIIGTAGAIAAGIGALAIWVVRDFIWPLVGPLFHK